MRAPLVAGTLLAAAAAATAAPPSALEGQALPPLGREAAEGLVFPPLRFDPPEATLHHLPGGIEVLHLEDRSLPLVDVVVRFRGGYALFPREYYAASVALPNLMRNGGTRRLPPDSVDALFDRWALQTSFGGGGESASASLNVLRRHLAPALELWGELLENPGFDPDAVEIWRGRRLESTRRRADDPASLAYSEFNRLMYGDHPVGWQMTPGDLEPSDLAPERLRWVHSRVFCPDNMVLGVSGDVPWPEVEPLLRAMLEGWPPCPEAVPEPRIADIRKEPGVFLIPRELNQSTVVMAHATEVRLGDDEAYFASRIANAILGSGGLHSRLMSRVRTDEGYAYGVSSLWTAPRRSPGLLGAVTRTRSETTVATVQLMLDIFRETTEAPPTEDELDTAVDSYANGFVFNFESPAQIVSRQVLYRSDGFPEDWLVRYLEGIQEVSSADVQEVFRAHVRPEEMIILVVGHPEEFGRPLEVLGPVTVLDAGTGPDLGAPSGGRQSPR